MEQTKNDNMHWDKVNVARGGWTVSSMFLIALSFPNCFRTEVLHGQETQKIINDTSVCLSPQ